MGYENLTVIYKMSIWFSRVVTRQDGCESSADKLKHIRIIYLFDEIFFFNEPFVFEFTHLFLLISI